MSPGDEDQGVVVEDPAGRTALVSRRLDHRLRVDVGVPVADVPAAHWGRVEPGPGERFGYRWPLLDGNDIVVAYSPEVIADQTRWLAEGEFGRYLDLLEDLLARAAVDLWVHPERAPDERRRVVEDRLGDDRPADVRWLSDVQLHILDLVNPSTAPAHST